MRVPRTDGPGDTYSIAVVRLASAGRRIGLRPGRSADRLSEDLALAGFRLDQGSVRVAASFAAIVVFVPSIMAALALSAFTSSGLLYLMLPSAAACGIAAHALIMSHPSRACSRTTKEVLRDSMAGTNLMIMSLRQEQSLSSAMLFASKGKGAFRTELRRCIWEVVMGRHAGFEEALQRFGERFARRCGEFKTSMDALVTASCESTQEGQRRALDRANGAMVAGAKRRIEEYALSLSTPSMVMFGVGILLPLMVGSFLPMLSWDLWSMGDGARDAGMPGKLTVTPETVFVMNILFPSIAALVALSTWSMHPMPRDEDFLRASMGWPTLAGVILASSVGVVLSIRFMDGLFEALGTLWSVIAPAGAWLAMRGSRCGPGPQSGLALESALFRTGARMTEGKNFEKAFGESAAETEGRSGTLLRTLCLGGLVSGDGSQMAEALSASGTEARNCLEALEVVRRAATKDEPGAGVLAMDLAAYLRDLGELEAALRLRLRPVASMMKVTAYALAPVVLGVTFAIYLSLASIAGVDTDPNASGEFLLVLGLFLAETNAAVMYFVWAAEGGKGRAQLMASVGQCVLCSEMVYSATAIIVAG